ncbi:MAG TPA: hypothetical protein VKQ54_18195 [Caulobacteraceae bacterium]|nr:hypothetical protein [Caulobacteraceae bacterium]
MPALENPRHETFAQARANGALLNDAYGSAGFVLHRGHPSRLANRAEVAERIAELRALRTEAEAHTPLALLASLRRIVRAGEGSENPALVREARLAIVEAARLQVELARLQGPNERKLDRDFNGFAASGVADRLPEGATEPSAAPRGAPTAAPPEPRRSPASAPPAPRLLPSGSATAPRHLRGRSPS